MTRRLLLSYLALAVLILLILEVPLAVLAQRFERELATNQVERETSGLVALVSDEMGAAQRTHLQSIVADYESRTAGEVSVVGAGGVVLVSSSRDRDHDDLQVWKEVTDRGLSGQTAGIYTYDEGRPYAVASAPVVEDGKLVAAVLLGQPAGLTEHRIHEIWLALGIVAAGAVVAAAVAGVVMARSMSLPLGRLEHTVRRFGRGDLGSRANERSGPTEVKALARQFNQMAGQLDELIQAQKRFVADASHQLRSPLTALRLRIENLEATAEESTVESVSAVGREVQRLSRIVDGLLALGRAGDDFPTSVVAVAPVIQERCDAWAALAAEKDVVLESRQGSEAAVEVPLHRGDLEQMLDNLLSNAVEISPAGSRIVVDLCRDESGRFEIHVTDEGPGMGQEDRKRAFDRFWQGPNPSGHSGLGLAIVRQLAGRNGLDVELRAAASGGLEAVISLPPAG